MPYDEELAERIDAVLPGRKGISRRKMFGGVGYLLNGNMLVGVWKDMLIVRLGVDEADEALKEPDVRVFDITGKAMKGWVMVRPDGLERDAQLMEWIERATQFVRKLPAK